MNRSTKAIPFVIGGIVLILVILVAVFSFNNINIPPFVTFLIAVTVAIVALAISLFLVNRQIRQLLRQPSVEPFFNYYESALARLPDSRYHIASANGVIAALYGEFTKASRIYESLDWSKHGKFIAAQGMLIQVLLDYLSTKDYEDGYNRAVTAQQFGKTSNLNPGTKISGSLFSCCVHVGEILKGDASDVVIDKLKSEFKVLPLLGKLIAAWGLAIAYEARGNQIEYLHMKEYIQKQGPHCRALHLP